jgi:hypothetical protein
MIIERLKRPIEKNMYITKGTTPIIYFGSYDHAKSCTISINPSDREFLDKNGNILTGQKERLCSRIKLGKNDTESLMDNDVDVILKYCNNYFQINPYKNWFNKYDYMIDKFGYSFYNNTCVHLDLVQWATTPFWHDINENIKSQHLKNDLPVLEYLLNKKFDTMFLNGLTVVSNIHRYLRNITINEKETTYRNNNGNESTIKIYTGNYNNIKIIGWSIYLQSQSVGGYNNIDILYKTIRNKI